MKPIREDVKFKEKAFKRAQQRANEASGVNSHLSGHSPSRKAAPSIELFQREDCPFSHAVRTRLTELGLDYIAHNVSPSIPLKHEQLVQAGGKDQIPFLMDHQSGAKLYETSAIIAYLESQYGQPVPGKLLQLAKGLESQLRSRTETIRWAVRMPVEKLSGARKQMDDLLGTLSGSVRFLKDTVAQVRSKAS